MTAPRHTSVSAHLGDQETDIVSDGNRTLALLQTNKSSGTSAIIRKKKEKQSPPTQNEAPIAINGIVGPSSNHILQ